MAHIAAYLKGVADALLGSKSKANPDDLLYAEKDGGFQCGTCQYARYSPIGGPDRATCDIMHGAISLTKGCCAVWTPNMSKLESVPEQTAPTPQPPTFQGPR